jgi:hypothetical protein
MRWRCIALVVFLLPLLTSCEGIFPPGDCTLIGCTDGLGVRLAEAPQGPYTIEVQLPDGESRTFECRQAGQCPAVAFFPGITAEMVTLRLTTSAGTRTEAVRPTYTKQRPNGRRCPPECWQAEVTLRLPEQA